MNIKMLFLLMKFNELFDKIKNYNINDIDLEKFSELDKELIDILEEYDYIIDF